MRLTLFHGSDDGFTFVGVIIFLLVLMLLVPAVSALLAGKLGESERILKERHELFEERQVQLEEDNAAYAGDEAYPPLTDVWKTAGEYLLERAEDRALSKRRKKGVLLPVIGKTGGGL